MYAASSVTPSDGSWNMAVDEALLAGSANDGTWTIRFYGWSRATLSLGYFQQAAEREEHASSTSCPLVRRPSGGGAILHDNELTYSVIAPRSDPRTERPERLYEAFHTALILALADCGVPGARLCGETAANQPSPEPFLCFQRRTPLDVLLGEAKIAGSAQRRRASAVLMHGSVLLKASPAAPELPGIADVSGVSLTRETLAAAWLDQLRLAFDWNVIPSGVVSLMGN